VESGWGASTNTQTQVDTQYAPCGCSPLGKMSAVSMPYKPSDPTVWTTYAYDERGRTVSITAPDGSATTFQYPTTVTDPANNTFTGNLVKTIDAAGKWKIQQSDAMGNLIKVLEPNPANPTGSAWLVTSYTYNGLNQLTNVSMPRSNGTQSRTFSYTGLDLTSATNPENGTVTYTYDNAHHMLTKTDAKQQQVHYNYDQYGRLTDVYRYAMINGQLTEQPAQRVHYYYDSNPVESGFSSNANGRLAAVEMPDENANYGRVFYYEYSYSQSGRVSTQRMRVVGDIQGVSSPINFDASYGWDQEGRMTSLNYPSTGPQYSYRYDSLGRLSSLYEQGNGSPSATVTYGNAGQVLGMSYWAVSETRQYNSLLQMTRMTANAFGTTVMDNQYLYTAGQNNGRITSSVDGYLSNETVNYTYDALNRLTGAAATNGAWSQSYAYDGFGNLTDKTQNGGNVFQLTFDPATNHQNGVNYDANGNPTDGKIYDVENRIISEPGYQQYTYDYRGKRITKLMGSTTELYFYGIDGRKLATYQCAAGTQQNGYQFTCSSPAFDTYWKGKLVKSKGQEVTTDRLGSVRWAREDGWRAYFPYGEERWASNDNREKFGTYMRDNSTQDYADQRYYGPGTGRFYTTDPSGRKAVSLRIPSSWNAFSYGLGDPIGYNDPRGLNVDVCDAAEPEDCEPDCDDEEEDCEVGEGGGGGGGGGGDYQEDTTVCPSCVVIKVDACPANTELNKITGVGCVPIDAPREAKPPQPFSFFINLGSPQTGDDDNKEPDRPQLGMPGVPPYKLNPNRRFTPPTRSTPRPSPGPKLLPTKPIRTPLPTDPTKNQWYQLWNILYKLTNGDIVVIPPIVDINKLRNLALTGQSSTM
jgi:RHS repeat-associated protein